MGLVSTTFLVFNPLKMFKIQKGKVSGHGLAKSLSQWSRNREGARSLKCPFFLYQDGASCPWMWDTGTTVSLIVPDRWWFQISGWQGKETEADENVYLAREKEDLFEGTVCTGHWDVLCAHRCMQRAGEGNLTETWGKEDGSLRFFLFERQDSKKLCKFIVICHRKEWFHLRILCLAKWVSFLEGFKIGYIRV